MSLFEDIKELSGGKPHGNVWWRNQLFWALEGADGPIPTTAVTFTYRAEYGEKMRFWDKYPMVYILGEGGQHFWGANVHYLQPAARSAGFSVAAPPQTIHKYLRSNVISPLKKIPESEYDDIGLLPTEQWISTINGVQVPIPSAIVYKNYL